MQKPVFYRGDTFRLVARIRGVVNGVATTDFTGYSLQSQIRDPKGAQIAALTCSWLNQQEGVAEILFPGATNNWALTNAVMNVRVVKDDGTHRVSSPPVSFSIEEPPTR